MGAEVRVAPSVSRIDPPGFGFPYTVDPRVFTFGLSALVANQAWFLRCFGGGHITKIGLQVGVQSGNLCVGVYSPTGSGRAAAPGARKATSGSVACPATGYQEVALTAAVDVLQGDFLAIVADNATATFGRLSTAGSTTAIANGLCAFQSAAFPLPDPAASSAGSLASWVLVGVP